MQLWLSHPSDDSGRHTHAQEKTQYSPGQDDPSTLQTQPFSSPATRTSSMHEQLKGCLNSGQQRANDGPRSGMIPVLFHQVQFGLFLYSSMDCSLWCLSQKSHSSHLLCEYIGCREHLFSVPNSCAVLPCTANWLHFFRLETSAFHCFHCP